jgi:hypothetical protein
VRKSGFETFVHPSAAIQQTIEQAGFHLRRRRETVMWTIDVFERTEHIGVKDAQVRFGRKVMDQSDVPIVCSLTPEALQARRLGLLSELLDLAESREPFPEGMRLRFPPEPVTLSAIARAVEAERHCCRFLRVSITVEPDNGPIVLELTGPRGTGEFLAGLFGQ